MSPQQKRLGIIILASFFGLLILIGVGITIFNSQRGRVNFTKITPHDATVKLDGKEIKIGIHYVDPGKHTFEISRRAFVNKKFDFEIKAGDKQDFDLYIVPDEDAGLEWTRQNPEETAELDGYISRQYDKDSQRIFDNNTIFQDLPIIDTGFRIDQGVPTQKGKDFALYIQADDDAGKAAALETLRYMGYNPDNFEIIYTKPE